MATVLGMSMVDRWFCLIKATKEIDFHKKKN